jgi:tRNA nucleotidyltransferase (CCA-adding enzyme)
VIGERLLCAGVDKTSLTAAASLTHSPALADTAHKPSEIASQLDGLPEIALMATWIVREEPLVRERIERYLQVWRHTRPITTGSTLKGLGLPPGPRYKILLERLRAARIDGKVITEEDEAQFLETLIATTTES